MSQHNDDTRTGYEQTAPEALDTSRPQKLEPDALIEHLVPDASQVPDVRVLVGFLGRSTRDGHWRLYLTPTLNEYVEFAEADVVHSRTLEGDESRLGGTVVWVRREANLVHTRSVSREAQADFLRGHIVLSLGHAASLAPFIPEGGPAFVAPTGTIGSFLNPPCA